jgi:hypothetical protein
MRAPHWSATCLICVKLNVADESTSSDEPKIKQQEAALLFCKQCFDVLVEPVGRAEK